MYCDNHSGFQDDVFGNFHALINFAYEKQHILVDHEF
jgi:hypothetical protein